MRWFKSKKRAVSLPITEDDRDWIEDNFRWLFGVWGYPQIGLLQYVFNEASFPNSHKLAQPTAESLKDDICQLLGIDTNKVLIVFRDDIRDIKDMPYGFDGAPFESEVDLQPELKQVTLASNLKKHGARLLHCLVLALVEVRLYEDELKYDSGEDSEHFIFLAAVYQGFGAIILKNLVDRGKSIDGFWESTWNFGTIVPEEVLAYSLALYMNITRLTEPNWLGDLNERQRKLIQTSLSYLKENPSKLEREAEVQAQKFLSQGSELAKENKFQEAIQVTRKGLFLSEDAILLSDLHNNIGYYQQRLGQYEMSIESFNSALALDDGNAYAFSNMSYSIMMMNRLDVAEPLVREQLEISDDLGFAHRNLAVYHWKVGKPELAEAHFQEGLRQGNTTDLLELHYAQFLWEQGRADESRTQLAVALERKEPEALAWSKEVGPDL